MKKIEKHTQYVKVKRLEATYFVTCDEYDNVGTIKAKIASLADRPPETIRLYISKKVSFVSFNHISRWTTTSPATIKKCRTTPR